MPRDAGHAQCRRADAGGCKMLAVPECRCPGMQDACSAGALLPQGCRTLAAPAGWSGWLVPRDAGCSQGLIVGVED